MGNCIATIVRQSPTTALVTLTSTFGGIATITNISQPPVVSNCTATINPDFTITLSNIIDTATIWFYPDTITGTSSQGYSTVGSVQNATQASPLHVPPYIIPPVLPCSCTPAMPMTGETYMHVVRSRSAIAGPGVGPDVRIVARRSWGDDFAGCNVCNH